MPIGAEKEKLTVMIIPHSEKAVREVQVSLKWIRRGLYALGLLFGAMVFAVTCLIFGYLQMQENMEELKRLRKVNSVQAGQLARLAEETTLLQERLNRLRALDEEVRKLIGMQNSDVSPPSRSADFRQMEETINIAVFSEGSPKTFDGVEKIKRLRQEARVILIQAEQQEESLRELKSKITRRQNILEATPSIKPARGRITSFFGYRRHPLTWRREFHEGVDIAAPRGTPVYAAAKGVVIYSGWKSGYGKTVIINHGYGYQTLYAHNSKLLVKVGEQVKKGEIIARVGSTGRSTGPHLHYEVRVEGKLVNPQKYF